MKIQIFFQHLHWRLFCSTPLHSSLWFVPGTGLMHFTLSNTLWGCSGRGGEKKVESAEWGEIADSWWNPCERGLGFVNPRASKPPRCERVACACCQGQGCTDAGAHPVFGAIPVSHTGLPWLHSHRYLPRTGTNAFSAYQGSQGESGQLNIPPSPHAHAQAWLAGGANSTMPGATLCFAGTALGQQAPEQSR